MSDGTSIEWTDATLNVVNGCSIVSPGCTNCYAMRSGSRGLPNHPATGLTKPSKAGHVWTGEVRFNDKALLQPLRWKRPRKIFWNAHGDLFHEAVPDEWIDRCFAVMALTPQHIHQVLTKRPERMRNYFAEPSYIDGGGQQRGREIEVHEQWRLMREGWREALPWSREFDWSFNNAQGLGGCQAAFPLPNVWLGVSVEDQQRAAERIPELLATPAAVRWLSCEPLLGPVDLDPWLFPKIAFGADHACVAPNWVVAGGESGPGARPMHPDWARSLRDQCAAAGVPFLFKQWGEFGPDLGQDDDFDREGYRRDRVMEGAGPCAAWLGDRWQMAPDGYAMPLDLPGDDHDWVYRLGKKRTGRLLDGQLHDGFPA